jgi:hypothetical protein
VRSTPHTRLGKASAMVRTTLDYGPSGLWVVPAAQSTEGGRTALTNPQFPPSLDLVETK